MSLATNIVRRQGSRNYYVRVGIPKDLQTRLGTPGKPKRERWQSLNTTNPYDAKRSGRPIVDQWEREFEELRRPKQLTEAELQDAMWRRYLELVTADEKFRQALPTGEDQIQIWAHLESEFGGVHELDAFRILEMIRDEFEEDQRQRAARLAKIRTDAARGETEAVASVVRRVMDERRLDLETRSPEYRKLAQGIQRAELEALNRSAERDAGDWSGQPKDKLVHPRWTFHFTPTSASWLNAVEGFFAKLTKRRLKRGIFPSVVDLQAAIHRFVIEHNAKPKPFTWTADPDKIIQAVRRGHQGLDFIHSHDC